MDRLTFDRNRKLFRGKNEKGICFFESLLQCQDVFGNHLNDKVRVLGKVGYISGFTGRGAYIKDFDNRYITLPNKSYKQVGILNLKLVCHNNNWQYITSTNV